MPLISGGGAGTVLGVTAADTSIVVAGTVARPTVATGTLDVIAADHAPVADWSNNSHRITGLANGSAATDAAAFGQIPTGAWALLTNTTLGADGPFDVSSISQSYSDLILILICRGTNAALNDSVVMQFNGDTTATYYRQRTSSSSTTITGTEGIGANSITAGVAPSATAAAGLWGFFMFEIPGYTSTTWDKGVILSNGFSIALSTTNVFNATEFGLWASTAAVNRVRLFGLTATNLLAGSTLRIYGRP